MRRGDFREGGSFAGDGFGCIKCWKLFGSEEFRSSVFTGAVVHMVKLRYWDLFTCVKACNAGREGCCPLEGKCCGNEDML